jgi:CRISPR-associated endoribonuclease Cas6
MPYSLIFELTPQIPIAPGYLAGKHLHALFLTVVNSRDPALATQLHGQTNNKAFTISPLQIQGNNHRSRQGLAAHLLIAEHRQAIPAGTSCWFRVSLLDEKLFSQLTQLWLNINPQKPWHLGPADLFISRILGTANPNQPWANFMSYSSLYEQASDSETQIDLAFCTPTAFRQQKFDTSMPTAEAVFGSLLRRWNQYAERSFEPNIPQPIFPSFFDIQSQIVMEARSKFIGCVGHVSYRIMGDVPPETIKQINTLADFAIYAGVGRKTPMGMGMVRRLAPKTHSCSTAQPTARPKLRQKQLVA